MMETALWQEPRQRWLPVSGLGARTVRRVRMRIRMAPTRIGQPFCAPYGLRAQAS
jgi:hypothetical protein